MLDLPRMGMISGQDLDQTARYEDGHQSILTEIRTTNVRFLIMGWMTMNQYMIIYDVLAPTHGKKPRSEFSRSSIL